MKNRKRVISIAIMLVISISLMSCSSQNSQKSTNTDSKDNITTPPSEQPTSEKETPTVINPTASPSENKVLVVYFSNTGNTKKIAEFISKGLNADTYEIIAQEPYTAADLNYNDKNSRSTKEMNDSSARPAISGIVETMSQYTTVFIGYPILWGEAPRILATFVESYDFSDKTVIPFCTSGGSALGSSARNLEKLAGAGTWLEGERFSGNESSDTVMDWVNKVKIQ